MLLPTWVLVVARFLVLAELEDGEHVTHPAPAERLLAEIIGKVMSGMVAMMNLFARRLAFPPCMVHKKKKSS
jgi:hypothetical protein